MGIMAKLFSAHWHPHPKPFVCLPRLFSKGTLPVVLAVPHWHWGHP